MTAARAPGGPWRGPLLCVRFACVQMGERQVSGARYACTWRADAVILDTAQADGRVW